MVLGISLPSIPLQGKKVEITVEHLAFCRGDIQGKGHGNMRTKEPEGVFYSLFFEKHPNTYYLGIGFVFVLWSLELFYIK